MDYRRYVYYHYISESDMVDEATMDRLVYIKHQHRKAAELSKEPIPTSTLSITMFHDAVELFLHLCSEKSGGSDQYKLMDYWNEINQKSGTTLEYKASIKRLNRIRNNLKHHGARPSQSEIESQRSSVNEFFETNTKKFFGLDYGEISLSQLIRFEKAREQVESAERSLAEGDLENAICMVSAAFDNIMEELDDRVEYQLDYNLISNVRPYKIAPDIRGEDLFDNIGSRTDMDLAEDEMDEVAVNILKLEKSVEDLTEKVSELNDTVRFDSLDIDNWKLQRFQSLTPTVTDEGEPRKQNWSGQGASEEDVKFCIDFVVDVALTLQDSPLDLDQEVTTPPTLSDF